MAYEDGPDLLFEEFDAFVGAGRVWGGCESEGGEEESGRSRHDEYTSDKSI